MTRILLLCLLAWTSRVAIAQEAPQFQRDVQPVLNKYCVGCHNDQDKEGELSLQSFAQLNRKTESGRLVVQGKPGASRLLSVVTGRAEPKMPPEDSPQPTQADIAILTRWIKSGAQGPRNPQRPRLDVPKIPASKKIKTAVTALAWSRDDKWIATGRFGEVTLFDHNKTLQWRITGLPGKINSLRFSRDGKTLAVASGIAGFDGQALLLSVAQGIKVRTFSGHRDALYAAVLNHNGSVLATAGYDRQIILWNAATGEQLHRLSGHNDAIYDLDFSLDGTVLASASGDETIKLWNTENGERLDTRSEPLAEQFSVRFSPNNKHIVAGGADNRIRVWKFVSKTRPQINPIVYSRFAHEGSVTQLGFTANGQRLVSVADDQSIKLWDTADYSPLHVFERQPDSVLSLAVSPAQQEIVVGRMNGSLQAYPIPSLASRSKAATDQRISAPNVVALANNMPEKNAKTLTETEPNNIPEQAMAIDVPATIDGVIHATDNSSQDYDVYRFSARAGQQFVVETRAARDKSPLDSRVEVLNADGQPIPRVLLRAVRDSYFTFRGKDSNTSDDFRVHNWEEMELNQYIFSNGEVNRLFMYPRGPDSGFKVYPGRGSRWAYFGTTPNSHALQEPCYIVEPNPPGTKFLPNGLPVFTVNYENDDDGRRKLGKDSFLIFTAPHDGDFLVRVSDTRSFEGEKFKYKLMVRPPRPDFTIKLGGGSKIGRGSGKEFNVTINRQDGFNGEVRVDISNLPPGISATTPLIIEAGHNRALGTVFAAADSPEFTAEVAKKIKVTATTRIQGEPVTKNVNNFGEIKITKTPKVIVEVLTAAGQSAPADGPLELTISPGQTVTARVRITREKGFNGRVGFGKEDAGRNLSHGLYVANIGLNGLLIVDGQTEREFVIAAAKWVPESSRLFHLRADTDGGQTSLPVLIHVKRADALANN